MCGLKHSEHLHIPSTNNKRLKTPSVVRPNIILGWTNRRQAGKNDAGGYLTPFHGKFTQKKIPKIKRRRTNMGCTRDSGHIGWTLVLQPQVNQ